MIRPEYRKFYGPAWKRYRLALIFAHGICCQHCGQKTERYLAAAHLTHDPRSSSVALLCAACHARHDSAHAYAVRRRNRAKRCGQAWLWADVEWDPFPVWQRPRRVLEMQKPRQGELWAA